MPDFEYRALTPGGERVSGVLPGTSQAAVLSELESRRLVPISVEPRRERGSRAGSGGTPGAPRRLGARALATTYAQMADLLRAGVPLLRALRLMAARKSAPRLAAVFRELADAVERGEELSAAMSERAGQFPKVHAAMVRAGEKGGFLEAVFQRLGQMMLAQADLRSKLIGSLIYPAMLVTFGAAVLLAIFGLFVPMFKPMFDRLGDRLPAVTKLVFALSDVIAGAGLWAAPVLALAVLAGWRLSRRADVRSKLARARTRAPVVGSLVRAVSAARFCRMLGTMLANGVPMLSALQIARDAAGNPVLEDAIDAATESVRQGRALSVPLGESGVFEDDVVEMIAVGESANNLGEVLLTIADTLEQRVDRLLTGAVRLVEPLLLLALAGAVVVVALALILPMTQFSALAGES